MFLDFFFFLVLPKTPVEWDVLVKEDVVKTSLWTVLGHNGHVWNLDTATDELTQVGVIQFPEGKENRVFLIRQMMRSFKIRWESLTLPDLFDFFSNSPGQGEGLCLDLLYSDCSAITAEEEKTVTFLSSCC